MISRIRTAVVLAAIAAGTTACTSTEDHATGQATGEARAAAEEGRLRLESAARASGKGPADGVLATAKESFAPSNLVDGHITDRGFEIDAIYYGKGESGGGWSFVDISVRLCVRFEVTLGDSPAAESHNTDCPASPPPPDPYFRTVDKTVRLTD